MGGGPEFNCEKHPNHYRLNCTECASENVAAVAITDSGLRDSGQRQKFATGAVRDTTGGKPLLELLPGWALFAWAWIMEAGALKYAARNWEQGMPMSRYLASAHRHLELYRLGFRDEPHLWQALWNVGGCIHTSIMVHIGIYPAEFYDLPNHVGKEQPPVLGEFERVRVDTLMKSSKDTNPIRPASIK